MTTFKCGWSDVSGKYEGRRFLLAEKTQLQTDVNDNVNIISSKKSEPAIKRIMLGEKELVEDLEESIAMLLQVLQLPRENKTREPKWQVKYLFRIFTRPYISMRLSDQCHL